MLVHDDPIGVSKPRADFRPCAISLMQVFFCLLNHIAEVLPFKYDRLWLLISLMYPILDMYIILYRNVK